MLGSSQAARFDAAGTRWLRAPAFDLTLIVGVFVLALLLGGLALTSPQRFMRVFYIDFWLLAAPHVVSTFTRIAFDRISVRRYRFLLFGLPPLVFLATAGAAWLGGAIILNTLYFCWQTWHYTRQSHGIARAYRRAASPGAKGHDRLTECVVFGFPVWGLLHRAFQQPVEFFGSPIWCIELPESLLTAAGTFALGSLAWWCWRQVRADRDALRLAPALFVLSHVAITMIGYVFVPDITHGWLFINIWHNAQYLMFVWASNARRFEAGVDGQRPLLSWLCQPAQRFHYALVCLGMGAVFYFVLAQAAKLMTWQALPLALVCYQTATFHHYLVDALIWRSPRRAAEKEKPCQPDHCGNDALTDQHHNVAPSHEISVKTCA